MVTTRGLVIAILGVMLTGYASMSNLPPPEVQQALAPTGKLRVGLYLDSPTHVIRTPSRER